MARKPKPGTPGYIPPRPTSLPKLPFSMGDRGAFIRKAWVAVEPAGREYFYSIYFSFANGTVESGVVGKDDIDVDHLGVKAFYVDTVGVTRTHLQWLKIQALRGGATPDAIRLLRSAVGLTKKEEAEMTAKEKLAKSGAKTKPVGGGGKVAAASGKKGGNPEALAKAREASAARNAENHAKKITVKVSKKDTQAEDFKLRGGRLAKLQHVIESKPKTVGDVIGATVKDDKGEEHKIDMGSLRGMEKRGHIAIG